ncbi:hypothetical protein GCM10011385_11580 [Nitratireductor aestuarii]|uniref:TadE-like domain-containing protein n=1 Tax=Nitratireductor aestuarii TaxID=1735103 RepID=A0A916RJD5_9HYPH|nr:TadE/TadG family type IV pilus assembly protein [Nitratireductor aestuarii]GGA59524.1 hypothetical protein GCM10011385_11580 [Nitratireductor aestuarii]
MRRLVRSARAFLRRTQGVAAVEFALLAPLMIALFILTMEFAQAIDTSRKVARMTVQIGDLITQQPDMTPTTLQSIVKIAEATIQPYKRSTAAVRVTAIDITTGSAPQPKVAWSKCYYDCAALPSATKGATVTLSNDLKIPGMYLIRVETRLAYRPMVAWSEGAKQVLGLFSLDNIMMGDRYDQHPRVSTKIPCNNC